MVGLVVGCAALALRIPGRADDATLPWAGVVRDGVLLAVGTIVVVIGLGQLGRPALTPPRWNWVSFLGLTVPGVVVLLFVRGPLEAANRRGRRSPSPGRRLASELLLVVGLALMIYGSVSSLTLGRDGYHRGLVGNWAGVAVWLGAAAFLVAVRGSFKLAWPERSDRPGRALAGALLLAVGLAALAEGERSAMLGATPIPFPHGAWPAATAIVLGGLAVLVALRPMVRAQPGEPPRAGITAGPGLGLG